MAALIIVIEDEPPVIEAIVASLEPDDYRILTASDGAAGLKLVRSEHPDLVLLDLMLPKLGGMDVCARIREHSEVPIIMVTGMDTEDEKVAGLIQGADDYICKPFLARELRARVDAVLRRSTHWSDGQDDLTFEVGDLVVWPAAREVKLRGERVKLTPKEHDLIEHLARNAGKVVPREELLREVWGEDEYIDPRTLDVHIRWLREKLEDEPSKPRRLITLRGKGYVLGAG